MATAVRAVEQARGDVLEQRMLDRHRTVGHIPGVARPATPQLLTSRMRSTLEALAQPDEP
jgi:hypothetical protein